MQKISTVVLLLVGLVLIIMVSVYLVLMEFQKKAEISVLNPYSYIPGDARLIYKTNQPLELSANLEFLSPFPEEISDILPINRFRNHLHKSINSPASDTQVLLHNTSLVISWHHAPKSEKDSWLFVLAFPHRKKAEKMMMDVVKQLFPESPIERSDTANQKIYSIAPTENSRQFYLTYDKNFVIISSDKSLILKSVNAGINQKGVQYAQSSFSDVLASSNHTDNLLFIETSEFCGFITDYFFWDHPLSIDCSIISGWISLTVNSDEETPGFDGLLFTNKDLPGIFSTLNFQEPTVTNIINLIPSVPSLVYHHHMPDTELFEHDFGFVLQQNKKYSLHELQKRRFSDVTGMSTDSISDYWTGELAMVLPGELQWENEYPVVLLGVNKFDEILLHPGLGIFFLDSANDNEKSYLPGQLMEISIPGFFQSFTSGLIKDDLRWAIHYDEYIFASAKKENLVKYFEILHKKNDTIVTAEDIIFTNAINDKHNIMLYYSVPVLLNAFEVMFTDRFLDLQELAMPSFPDFGQMTWQFSSGPRDRVYSEIRFKFIENQYFD